MKLSTLLPLTLSSLCAAQTQFTGTYTDTKSGITFQAMQDSTSGYFFGIALPETTAGNTDFIATIGGKGTGWAGVSLGGGMVNKLLIAAWPNGQSIVSTFRKTAQYGPPAVATGTFSMSPIANGTYVNGTHFTYTFLCSKCILADKTTFAPDAAQPTLGWAFNTAAPSQKASASSMMNKHSVEGNYIIDMTKARSANFATWKGYAGGRVQRDVEEGVIAEVAEEVVAREFWA
ncbi:iron reductase domain protein [Zopfia rhizophila CBS 207.26]|uniref:Iron reductase domain protein n=1 Tax=Zopfia rhizophila CBS 207.26 TaxID=1314779 RepID=A0A6A6ERT1_9PEZI|nr:iron reductase domain protein [Zopfia rhizophila CBS 207.26]